MPNASASKPVKTPGPDHPISIKPCADHVQVLLGGTVIADTHAALTLQESTYPPVLYIPLADVGKGLLEASSHSTYCPYKGDCSYYSIVAGKTKAKDAVWRYAEPYPAVSAIQDYVAFYPDRVDAIKRIPAA